MIALIISLLLLFLTPGPGVLSLGCVGAAFGVKVAVRYYIGLFIGANVVMIVCASGMVAVLEYGHTKLIFLTISSSYLCFLGYRIATVGTKISFFPAQYQPKWWEGAFLQIFNPKAYAVGIFVFSGFPIWQENIIIESLLKFLIINLIWIPIHIGWLYAGISLERLEVPERIQKKINWTLAIGLIVVVILSTLTI